MTKYYSLIQHENQTPKPDPQSFTSQSAAIDKMIAIARKLQAYYNQNGTNINIHPVGQVIELIDVQDPTKIYDTIGLHKVYTN